MGATYGEANKFNVFIYNSNAQSFNKNFPRRLQATASDVTLTVSLGKHRGYLITEGVGCEGKYSSRFDVVSLIDTYR